MKIIIIDDDPNTLKSLSTALGIAGHDSETYSNPRDAIERYTQENFDAVLTDVLMIEMDGVEVLKELRKINPNARVILFSGFAKLEMTIEALNNHAYAFFNKPLDIGKLLETLDAIAAEINEFVSQEQQRTNLMKEYERTRQAYENLKGLLVGKL